MDEGILCRHSDNSGSSIPFRTTTGHPKSLLEEANNCFIIVVTVEFLPKQNKYQESPSQMATHSRADYVKYKLGSFFSDSKEYENYICEENKYVDK